MSYYPLTIQQMDPDTESWTDLLHLHALQVNKTSGGETHNAGAEQYHPRLTFVLRWSSVLENVVYAPQIHRIVYKGRAYNIEDYDDFMEQHRTVRLVGVAYG